MFQEGGRTAQNIGQVLHKGDRRHINDCSKIHSTMTSRTQAVRRLDISSDLASTDSDSQENALLAVIALLSAGRDVTGYVSQICQYMCGNVSVPLPLRLKAYDVIRGCILGDADASHLQRGILSDLCLDAVPDNQNIQAAAFKAMRQLPTHRLIALMSDPDMVNVVRKHLRESSPRVRAAGAESIAMVMSFDTMMKLLAESKDLKQMFGNFIKNLSEMLIDPSMELSVAGAQSLQSLMETMSQKVRAAGVLLGKSTHKSKTIVSNYSQAAILALSVCEEVVMTIDGMFAEVLPKFRMLALDSKRQILKFLVSYLDSKALLYSLNSFDYRPGEILQHQMDEVVNFFAECAVSFDASLVVESTKALLSLVNVRFQMYFIKLSLVFSLSVNFLLSQIDRASASLYSQVTISIRASIDSINALEGRYQQVAQQGLLDTFLSHMDALPLAQQMTLFGKLPEMIATVPSSRQRVKAFVRLWYSVAAYDWRSNSCIDNIIKESDEAAFAPTSEIQHILLETRVKDCIAGSTGLQSNMDSNRPLHARYKDPVFREEIVGSLLYVLLTHPSPITGLSNSASLGKTSANSALIVASGIQAAGTALDWLFTSKSCLQSTKPCLGWDRVAGIKTTGTTASVDLWLQLLLRCISISSQLKSRLDELPGEHHLENKPQNSIDTPQSVEKNDAVTAGGISQLTSALRHRAGVMEVEFQNLLLQIASNWRALHPVVRPRAIWICANNLKLKNVLDASWSALADALRSLLIDGEHVGASNPSRFFASVAEGSIKTHPLTQSKKRSVHDPFVAAAAGETEEIGVLILERLADLLAKNHRGDLKGRLSDPAALLESLTILCTSTDNLSPSSLQRLERVQKLLAPISSSGRERATPNSGATSISVRQSLSTTGQCETKSTETDQTLVVDLEDDFQASYASYPSTVPSSPSLMHTDVVKRYQEFLGDLQSAIVSSDHSLGSLDDVSTTYFTTGLPNLSTSLEVLESESNPREASDDHSTWTEVAGIFSPLSLQISHLLEPLSSTIRLRCRLENKTAEKIQGIEVQLILGGPIAMHRRPLSYRIKPLNASESYGWEVPCRCLNFGWPIVQAFVNIPIESRSVSSFTYQSGAIRCKPYAISPLELILKAHRPIYSAEFFQMWQTFPHRANAYAMPKEKGMQGIVKVLSAIESAGLVSSSKVLVPVSGGVHAAYSGISWSGHTIALIVSTVTLPSGKGLRGAPKDAVLHFHFGSDASEVISPMRGHEHDLVNQLTKGRAVIVSSPLYINSLEPSTKAQSIAEPSEPQMQSTFSFFKSIIQNSNTDDEVENEHEKKIAVLRKQHNVKETFALTAAAVDSWLAMQ